MNTEQALSIVRMVAAYQPSQKLDDEYTHKAWIDGLSDLDFLDAAEAVKKLGKAPRRDGHPFFFELRDVLAEVHTAVARRVESRKALAPGPPSGLDAAEYRRWEIDQAAMLGRRDWAPARREIEHPARPVLSLIRGIAAIRDGAHPNPGEVS